MAILFLLFLRTYNMSFIIQVSDLEVVLTVHICFAFLPYRCVTFFSYFSHCLVLEKSKQILYELFTFNAHVMCIYHLM